MFGDMRVFGDFLKSFSVFIWSMEDLFLQNSSLNRLFLISFKDYQTNEVHVKRNV